MVFYRCCARLGPEGLPRGYTRAAYLENTDNQWIALPVVSSNNRYVFKAQVMMTSSDSPGLLFGSMNGFNVSVLTDKYYRATSSVISTVKMSTSKFDDLTLTVDPTENKITLKTNVKSFNGSYTGWAYGNTFHLFRKGGTDACAKYKLGPISIEKDYISILNMIPALDRNGRPCMYDTVTGTTFYNQGTGEFSYGI